MKKLCSILIVLLLSVSVFAGDNASATVSASLVKGLAITNVGGSSITFGEIILNGSAQTPTVAPGSGANFEVTGQPNRDVTITFSTADLNNDAWVTTNGGTNGTMTFTPNLEHTGSSSTYSTGTAVTSGNAYTLVNASGTGTLYLWAGGQLSVAADQAWGDYTGTFTVTVAY